MKNENLIGNKRTLVNILIDYKNLLDEETWNFVDKTNQLLGSLTGDKSIQFQRENFNKLWKSFSKISPKEIKKVDRLIDDVKIRTYFKKSNSSDLVDIIFFHGGGFVVGGINSHDSICTDICQKTGLTITSVDYRLAPENKHPIPLNDCMKSVNWISKNNKKPIILCGDSAGGWLAASLSHFYQETDIQIIGQVLIYPLLGANINEGSYISNANAPNLTTRDIIYYYKALYGNHVNDQFFDGPLLEKSFKNLPPTVIFSAEFDPLLDDGREYEKALIKDGSKVKFFLERGLIHGYLRGRDTVDLAKKSFNKICVSLNNLAESKWNY